MFTNSMEKVLTIPLLLPWKKKNAGEKIPFPSQTPLGLYDNAPRLREGMSELPAEIDLQSQIDASCIRFLQTHKQTHKSLALEYNNYIPFNGTFCNSFYGTHVVSMWHISSLYPLFQNTSTRKRQSTARLSDDQTEVQIKASLKFWKSNIMRL